MIFKAQEKAEQRLSLLLVFSKDRSLNHSDTSLSEYSDRHLLEHGDVADDKRAFNVANDFSSQRYFFFDFLDLRPGLQEDVPYHCWVEITRFKSMLIGCHRLI